MRLLGTGELAGLKARGRAKQEFDPILRNQRVREETQRAHMRALISVPPRDFPRAELGRIERFHVELVRVAPEKNQLPIEELHDALSPVRAGVADFLGGNRERIQFMHLQAVGPWAVRFSVWDASPVAVLTDVDPVDA